MPNPRVDCNYPAQNELQVTVIAVLNVRFPYARYRYGDGTASNRRGQPFVVAFSPAKRWSFGLRPSSGCFADPLRMRFRRRFSSSTSKGKPVVTRTVTAATNYMVISFR